MAAGERDEVPPETVEARERASLLAAFRRIAGEQGCRGVEIEAVTRAAGVPRERFDAYFESREEALIAAQAGFFDRLLDHVTRACRSAPTWPEQVRAGLHTLLANLGEAEGLARALAVEAPGESFGAAQRQLKALDQFAALLGEGRRRYPAAADLPPLTERLLIGGVSSMLSEHLLGEEAAALAALEPDLTELLLIPYLGNEEARRAASR